MEIISEEEVERLKAECKLKKVKEKLNEAVLSIVEVDAVICGGIGAGAQMALHSAGIQLFGGVSGSADEAVEKYIAGNLDYNPDVKCNHHGDHHGEGHSCGNHGCGSH